MALFRFPPTYYEELASKNHYFPKTILCEHILICPMSKKFEDLVGVSCEAIKDQVCNRHLKEGTHIYEMIVLFFCKVKVYNDPFPVRSFFLVFHTSLWSCSLGCFFIYTVHDHADQFSIGNLYGVAVGDKNILIEF